MVKPVQYWCGVVSDQSAPDDPPTTVSRRTALGAFGGALALGTAGVYATGSLASNGGGALAGTFDARTGESDHLGIGYAGRPILGSLDADLRLFYWTDYQCPYCARFESNTLPELARKDVADGDLAIVFLEFPVFGDDSATAAQASKCAWRSVRDNDPDAWGNWHQHVFDQQEDKNDGWASEANLYAYTDGVDGVTEADVRRCMDDRREHVTAAVRADVNTAIDDLALRRATPAFVASNPQSGRWLDVPGAQPYETFEKLFDRLRDR